MKTLNFAVLSQSQCPPWLIGLHFLGIIRKRGLTVFELLQPLFYGLFIPYIFGLIVVLLFQVIMEIGFLHIPSGFMGIFITLSVSHLLHHLSWGVPYVKRDRERSF